MLNHAAWCNKRRMDAAMKTAKDASQGTLGDSLTEAPVPAPVYGAKRFEDLNSEEMARYYEGGVL